MCKFLFRQFWVCFNRCRYQFLKLGQWFYIFLKTIYQVLMESITVWSCMLLKGYKNSCQWISVGASLRILIFWKFLLFLAIGRTCYFAIGYMDDIMSMKKIVHAISRVCSMWSNKITHMSINCGYRHMHKQTQNFSHHTKTTEYNTYTYVRDNTSLAYRSSRPTYKKAHP